MQLVLGLDVGGTATRALVTQLDGSPVGHGVAGAGNPVHLAPAAIFRAVDEALSSVDGHVLAAVVGMAGPADPAEIAKALSPVCHIVKVIGDVVTAFASGTGAKTGHVLISGTGAIAAEIVDMEQCRTADGLGWLLGDLGSGHWLGRRILTFAVKDMLQGSFQTPIAQLVAGLNDMRVTSRAEARHCADVLIAEAHLEPRTVARYATLLTLALEQHDTRARSLINEAALQLAGTLSDIRGRDATSPIVLSGSILRHTPVGKALELELRRVWKDCPINLAEPAEVGAARLARQLALGS